MKEIYIDWTKLSRNFNEIPLILDRSKNKREDLIFNDLKYLVDNYSFCEITKILNVSDNYLIRQLKLHNLKTNVDWRKKFNKLSHSISSYKDNAIFSFPQHSPRKKKSRHCAQLFI